MKKNWSHKIRTIFISNGIGMVGLTILAIAPKGLYVIICVRSLFHDPYASSGGIVMLFLSPTFIPITPFSSPIMAPPLPIVSSLTSTFIQTTVPLDKMGRVSSISAAISASILPIGTILSGPLAEILGISLLFFYCAILGLIVTSSIWTLTNIRKVDLDNVTENREKINEKINNVIN